MRWVIHMAARRYYHHNSEDPHSLQNEEDSTNGGPSFMALLYVRTRKCHATSRHCVVRFADSAIRIRVSCSTLQRS